MIYRRNIIHYALIALVCAGSYLCGYTINWGVSSRQGDRNYMEDYFTATEFTKTPSTTSSQKCHFFGIYDGHGGSTVSEELKDALPEKFYATWQKGKTIQETLQAALEAIENNLKPDEENQPVDSHNNAGSTAIIAVTDHDNSLHCANVGDSRAIVIRNGTVVFSTEDHKPHMSKELSRLERSGYALDSLQPNKVPRIKGLSLSRTIGDWNLKLQYPQAIISIPDLYRWKIKPGDILIMASDGLWDVLNNQAVAQLTLRTMEHGMVENFISQPTDTKHDITTGSRPPRMQEVAKALREVAYTRKSGDNITVIAAQFTRSPEEKTEAIASHIDLLITNAQQLKIALQNNTNNGLAQVLVNNLDEALKRIKKEMMPAD